MNIVTKTKIIISILLFALCAPLFAFAAEIRLDSHKAEVKTGEQFVVDVIVHSEEPLNAVEGRLSFPENLLSVREIHDGSSVVNFWIEKPHVDSSGVISFSGITPGGFGGPNNLLFSLVFEVDKSGDIQLSLLEAIALRNDGAGTNEPFSIRNVEIIAKPGDSKVRKETLLDMEPPEDFMPIIVSDRNIFDGKQVLVFATQDKASGIDRYKVKEFRFSFLSFLSPWTRSESPHVLKDQNLKSYILVKAIDNLGNERIATIAPRAALSWYDYISIIGILIIVLALCAFVFKTVWRRK